MSNNIFQAPPLSIHLLTNLKNLEKKLFELVGLDFGLTGKTRTDGSNIRKLVSETLYSKGLPLHSAKNNYEIVPLKGKGIPKITIEFIDTYIVTSESNYNLQVWNRIPNSKSVLINLENNEKLRCNDVRFVFLKVKDKSIIDSVIILTPEYIEQNFGKFGKPTIKHQLLISSKIRENVLQKPVHIFFFPDTEKLSYMVLDEFLKPSNNMMKEPNPNEIFSLKLIYNLVAKELIGLKIKSTSTKNVGQELERIVLNLLGYKVDINDTLDGSFPDIKNQLLEVKVQESPTIDLGKYTPEVEEVIVPESNLTTFDVRYLIALVEQNTGIIKGVILCPGEKLGEYFTFVSDKSYKCQRSIPSSFFKKFSGRSISNP